MKKVFIIFVLQLLCFAHIWSQTEGLETDQIEVFKNFDAQLDDAQKVEIIPKISKIDPVKKIYDYNITTVPLPIKYPDPLIRPLAMKVDDPFENYDFYAKLGYGTMKSPFGKMVYGQRDLYKYDFTVDLSHYGLDNTSKLELQKMSATEGRVSGKYRIRENMQMFGGVSTNLQTRYLYFTPTIKSENDDDYKRKINKFDLNFGIQNVEETNSGINYSAELILQNTKINEISTSGNESVTKFNAAIDKRLGDRLNVELPATIEYTVNNLTLSNRSYYILSAAPKINFHQGRFAASAGLSVIRDTYHGLRLFPMADLSFGVLGNFVQVFANSEQRYAQNGYNNLTRYCPFINQQIDELRSSVWNAISGGLRGELSFITYQGRVGYKQIKSNAFFRNDKLTPSTPSLLYDDANVVFVSGNIEFAASGVLKVGGVVTKNFFKLATLDRPFGVPSLDMNAYANFTFFEGKLNFKSELYLSDRVDALLINDSGSEIKTLNNQVDLNAGIEYWPVTAAGIYLSANNVMNNKYARWYGYPTVGINFSGGVVLKF